MATIITAVHNGLSVTGLTRSWDAANLQKAAERVGAYSIGFLDRERRSLLVVCDTDDLSVTAVTMSVEQLLTSEGLYTTKQEVSFIALEDGLVLVHFADGLPMGQPLFSPAESKAVVMAYGDSNVVLHRATGLTNERWQEVLRTLWHRLEARGAVAPPLAIGMPYIERPWARSAAGQIIMVDPGLAIVEATGHLRYLPTHGRRFHGDVPAEIIGSKYYAIGSHCEWPRSPLTYMERVALHVELGRACVGLASLSSIEADAGLIYPFPF